MELESWLVSEQLGYFVDIGKDVGRVLCPHNQCWGFHGDGSESGIVWALS